MGFLVFLLENGVVKGKSSGRTEADPKSLGEKEGPGLKRGVTNAKEQPHRVRIA